MMLNGSLCRHSISSESCMQRLVGRSPNFVFWQEVGYLVLYQDLHPSEAHDKY